MKLLVGVACCLIILFYSAGHVFAVDIETSNFPPNINQEEETIFDVKISGAQSNTLNYLRGAFKSGTSSYFGYTFNHNNEWFNGSPSDPKKFLQIQINADGGWEGQLRVKPDIADSAFKGNGIYSFKVGRYTENGSAVSTWSEDFSVELTGNEPTPTITPTPTKAPTPTKVPTPTKLNTPTPTIKITASPTQQASPTYKIVNEKLTINKEVEKNSSSSSETSTFVNKSVLGENIEENIAPTKPIKVDIKEQKNTSGDRMPIIAGVSFLCSACVILAYRKYKAAKEVDM